MIGQVLERAQNYSTGAVKAENDSIQVNIPVEDEVSELYTADTFQKSDHSSELKKKMDKLYRQILQNQQKFNETQKKYDDLKKKLETTTDPKEKAKIEAQMKDLMVTLNTLSAEGKRLNTEYMDTRKEWAKENLPKLKKEKETLLPKVTALESEAAKLNELIKEEGSLKTQKPQLEKELAKLPSAKKTVVDEERRKELLEDAEAYRRRAQMNLMMSQNYRMQGNMPMANYYFTLYWDDLMFADRAEKDAENATKTVIDPEIQKQRDVYEKPLAEINQKLMEIEKAKPKLKKVEEKLKPLKERLEEINYDINLGEEKSNA